MTFTRRDFIHAGCTAGAVALVASPMDKAKAFLHRSTGAAPSISGKNQVGLNGFSYFDNIKPFTNWFHLCSFEQVNITGSIASITQTGGVATITTTANHGFWTGTAQSGWTFGISGATPSGYNLSTANGFTITGPNTITYAVSAALASPATGTISYTANMFGSIAANSPNSANGTTTAPNQYLDANKMPAANIPNATSLQYRWLYHTLNGTSYQPAGYTRAGQIVQCHWTGAATGVAGGTGSWASIGAGAAAVTWTTPMDTQNVEFFFTFTNPADPPTSIYLGLDVNYADYQAGLQWDSTYLSQLSSSGGTLRCMDIMNVNGNYLNVLKYTDIATNAFQVWGSNWGCPVTLIIEASNRTAKHPWINIPWNLGQKAFAFVSNITHANPAVVTLPNGHPFNTGDQVIGDLIGGTGTSGSGGGMGVSASVTFTVATSRVNWTAHGFNNGQVVAFTGATGVLPSNIPGTTNFWVTNATANDFQLAVNYTNSIAGTNFAFTGSSTGTGTGSSQICRMIFTVGATTSTTIELAGCNSTSFGNSPVLTTTGGMVGPFSLSGMTTEIGTLITNVKNGLTTPGVVPKFAFGNEMWNTIFGGFHWNSAQARNFVNPTTGQQVFGIENNNFMQGYLAAHVMNIARTIYGASSGTTWEGVLETQSANSGVTSGLLSGVDYYITNVLSNTVTRNDLFSGLAVTGYYGGLGSKANGSGGNFPLATFGVASPGTVSTSATCSSISTDATGLIVTTNAAVVGGPIQPGWPLVVPGFNTIGFIQPYGTSGTTGTGGSGTYALTVTGNNHANLSTTATFGTVNTLPVGAPIIFSRVKATGTLAVGGLSTTNGDVIGITFTNAGIPSWPVTVNYTVNVDHANPLATQQFFVALGIQSAINSEPTFVDAGVSVAFLSGSTLTISQDGGTIGDPVLANSTVLSYTQGTNTETITFSNSGTLSGGTSLPNDLATGQPLIPGDMTPSYSGISGYWSGTTFVCTAAPANLPLRAGMTIWPPLAGSGSAGVRGGFIGNDTAYNGIRPDTIQSQQSGTTGGVGVYNMIKTQNVGSAGAPIAGCQAQNMTRNCQVYWMKSTGNNFTFAATQGGANINLDPTHPGSGNSNCLKGLCTLYCTWMNQSVALNASNPATYPSRYSFWSTTINQEIQTGQFTQLGGSMQPGWFPHVTYCVTTSSIMPTALKMFQYEGSQSNEPQSGTAPNGTAMTSNPMFQEFWPQQWGTNDDAANWTWMVSQWAGLKAYAISQGLPNASALVTQWPSKFTDGINTSYVFGFGGLTIIDHAQGTGYPTWQNQGMNTHALYDAVVGTN